MRYGSNDIDVNIKRNEELSTITIIEHFESEDGVYHDEDTFNIIYDTNKIIISVGGDEIDFIFNNELHSYPAETINNQVFHCISIIDMW